VLESSAIDIISSPSKVCENLFSDDMLSSFECDLMSSDDSTAVNLFLLPCHSDPDSILAEQSKIETDVKLSRLLQLDDTFSTEDQWPI